MENEKKGCPEPERNGHNMRRFEPGGCALNVDVGRTRAYYSRVHGIGCDCAGCRNYEKAAALFPEAVKALMEEMGISPEKPAEVYINGALCEGKSVSYGGFYHLCGTMEGEVPAPETIIAPGYAVWFRRECDLLDEAFPRPAIQMEIDFRVPWVLDEENTY